ncbi:MAG: hypothetical protein WBZ36_17750 [Candidatus Nitrosopolaris sp.]
MTFNLCKTVGRVELPIAATSGFHASLSKITFLAQPLAFSNLALPDESSITPYGADAPEWSDLLQTS